MQTIKLEKNQEEWARGRNGMIKTPTLCIYGAGETLTLAVDSQRGGKTSPILIVLKKENWARFLTALGEELGK